MTSALIKSTLKIVNRFTPLMLKRFGKSLLFSKKHFTPKIFNSCFRMPKELTELPTCTLILGHSNFLISSGGTERIIVEELEKSLSENIDTIFIYPKGEPEQLTLFRPKEYGLILNGFEICTISDLEVESFFCQIQEKVKHLKIHHLLFWPLTDILKLSTLYSSKGVKLDIHLHDFHFTCPKVNAFCKSGNLLCKNTYYSWTLKSWRRTFEKILRVAQTIIVPSEYMRSQAPRDLKEKTTVNLPLTPSLQKHRKLKLAYLGAASPIKGYSTWTQLAENALITRKYDLIHVGAGQSENPKISSISYSYKNSRSCEASEVLKSVEADLVLLWSQVPESYSFTFHEAMSANKFIITSEKSGNIAYSISQNKTQGVVLESEYQLIQFLLKKSQ